MKSAFKASETLIDEDDLKPGSSSSEAPSLVPIPPEDAKASLNRLLSSESISRAPRMRALLKFLVEALLDGKTEGINEQAIGQAVFGRPAGYNPGEDNIVRVTMRHLRERIEEFYRTEGREEQFVLSIPKGKYIPVLNLRQADEPAISAALTEVSSAVLPVVLSESTELAQKARALFPWTLVFLLGAVVAVLAFRNHSRPEAQPRQQQNRLLSLLLRDGKSTTIVVTDSNLQAYRMIFRKTVSLDAYIARSYITRSYEPTSTDSKDPVLAGAWNYVGMSTQTSLTSSIIAAEIAVAASPESIQVKHPQDLSVRDFQHGNFILLGGPWINPWGQLFEDRLNFRVIPLKDDPARSEIHSVSPLSNEKTDYVPHQRENLTVNYVRVALLRNLSNDGYVILLGATSEEALEAAGRFLIDPQQLADLLRSFKLAAPDKLPSFEAVIEVEGLRSVPENAHVVAERVVVPQ